MNVYGTVPPAPVKVIVGVVGEFCATVALQQIDALRFFVTVTVKEQVAELPAASLTVYVTVVTPTLKFLVPTLLIPLAGDEPVVAPVSTHVCVVTAQLSPVVGLGVATLDTQPGPFGIALMFDGHVIVGAVLSVTTTLYEQLAELPAASLTV